ncbi:Ig-like domain-containing protein [Candidatus Uhrbacteria bacterium]|nr:Ig-like domain-containing protein [Candidatus Uhrbacteria bacterium]
MKRIAVALSAISGLLLGFAPATAATPYQWTDISGQVQYRNNRPVWAMAYASGYWYFTDGQDLWNGGQVYRTDGASTSNITLDVRNAGMTRVDDIVTDGQSVLFLQNVMPRNNQFELVKYQYGSFTNLTVPLRTALSNDEGLVSVVGRNGEWLVTTSKARVLKWSGTNATPSQISLPQKFQDALNTIRAQSRFPYCMNSIESNWCPFSIVPVSGNAWLFTTGQSGYHNGLSWIPSVVYRYSGSSFTDISNEVRNLIGETYTPLVQSNGNDAIFFENGIAGGQSKAAIVSGSTVRAIANSHCAQVDGYGCWEILQYKGFWTGSEWVMVANSKQAFTWSENGGAWNLGKTQDYFVTGVSNGNGTILLGGAISDGAHPYGPSSPLTAKLVKLTSGYSAPTVTNVSYGSGGGVYTSTYGPRLTTQGSPSNFSVSNGGTFTYRATATDPNGIDRVDLYVNGAKIKTCYAEMCEFQSAYYTNGASSRNVSFSARATDRYGYTTNAATETLYVSGTSLYTPPSYIPTPPLPVVTPVSAANIPPAVWTWTIPGYITTLSYTSQYHVGAWDNDGISSIEIWVNGTNRRTCNLYGTKGNVECALDLSPSDYPSGSLLTLAARAVDSNGTVSWSDTRNLVVNPGYGITTSSPGNLPGWVTVTSNRDNGFSYGQTITFTADASDQNGIERIELLVNGVRQKTCVRASSCSWTGGPYYNQPAVSYGANLIDQSGYVLWTGYKTINKY